MIMKSVKITIKEKDKEVVSQNGRQKSCVSESYFPCFGFPPHYYPMFSETQVLSPKIFY